MFICEITNCTNLNSTWLQDIKLLSIKFKTIWFFYKLCNLSLSRNNRLKSIRFGNAMRSWFIDCDVKEIQKVYDGLKQFTEICYRPENQLIFPLKNGIYLSFKIQQYIF